MVRIFVSHSSKDIALTRAVCQELAASAPAGPTYETAAAVDILADYARLPDGAPWPKQLHEWLAKSQAGLILLTPDALASDWVLKEATILTWRQSLEERFNVFVASDTAVVTADALKSHRYAPLSMPSIQWIDSLDAATIAARVRQAIGPAPPPTLFERMVGELSDLMSEAVKPNTMRTLAERLRVEAPAWDPQRSDREQYLEEIARRLLTESLGGFNGVNDVIAELVKTVQVEPLIDILDFIAPYWVDAEVAGRLRALRGRRPPGAAAVNTTLPTHSGLMYIRRAHHMGYDYLLPDIAGGDAGQTAAEITGQICTWVRQRGYAAATADEQAIRDVLARWPNAIYVVLPERVDPDVLVELRSSFESVIFLMPTGAALVPDDRFADVDWLQPALDSAVEKREHTNYNAATAIIDNKRSGRLGRGR
jgi:TIR domain-containing protein